VVFPQEGLRVIRDNAPLPLITQGTLNEPIAQAAQRRAAMLTGPLLATGTGGKLHQGPPWELVRRLARTAGIRANLPFCGSAEDIACPASWPVGTGQDAPGHLNGPLA
jgi:hypothetical protein